MIDRRHCKQRGFSLIEMIAAFLVFAIAMGVLMQVLATSMRQTRQSSEYTMAALWAQSKLDTVGVGKRIEAGHSDGRFDDTYRWQLVLKSPKRDHLIQALEIVPTTHWQSELDPQSLL